MGNEENLKIGDDIALPALAKYLSCAIDDVDFTACDAQDSSKLGFLAEQKATSKQYWVIVEMDSSSITIKDA